MVSRMFGLFLLGFMFVSIPAGAEQEGVDAIYLEVTDEYTLHLDGSTVRRHEHKLKYLTPYAFSRVLGESFIVYNPEFQELEIVRAVTTMADGQEVVCTPNALNEVLPGFCRNAPPYMHLREMVVTHLGLEIDAVVHLVYVIRSVPEFSSFLMGEEIFSTRHPVQKKTVVIRVPSGTTLNSRMLHKPDVEPDKTEKDGFDVYTWTLSDLPMAPPEGMAQPEADYLPRLVFSTCPSWKEASGQLNQLLNRATYLEGPAKEKAGELFRETNSPVEFVRAVNRFVVEEVGYASIDPGYLGYKPLQAEKTLGYNVGCALDKMVLLVAMLRSQGYFAEPVFVSSNRTVAEDVPSWLQFRNARVIATMRDRLDKPLFLKNLLYLDPARLVESVFEDSLAGRTVFRPSLVNNQLQEISATDVKQNRLKIDLNLSLDEERKLLGDLSLEVGGSLNPYIRLVDGYQDWAEGRLKGLLPGAKIKALKPMLMDENRSIFSAAVDTPATLEKEENSGLYFYRIPQAPGGAAAMHIPVAPVKRTRPLWLPHTVHEEINVTISLPESMEAVYLPPQVDLTNAAGKFMSAVWVDEGVLYVKRALILPKQLISPDEYSALRGLMVEWSADDMRQVVFQEKSMD